MSGAASTTSSAPAAGRLAGGRHDLAGRAAARLADGHRGLAGDLVLGRLLVREDVALVDPDLHADAAVGRLRLAEAVVDVGPQRVQRHPTLAVPLGAAHLGATEATRALHADAERAGLLRVLHRTLHRPAERDASGQLIGDALRDERGVELGLLDLLDVQLDLVVAGDLREPGTKAIGLGAAAADDDAGTSGVHVDAQPVTGALDLDAADRRVRHLRHEVVADLPVLDEVVGVLAVAEPPALPVGGDTEAEPVRVDLLAHYSGSDPSVVVGLSGASSTASSAARLLGLDLRCAVVQVDFVDFQVDFVDFDHLGLDHVFVLVVIVLVVLVIVGLGGSRGSSAAASDPLATSGLGLLATAARGAVRGLRLVASPLTLEQRLGHAADDHHDVAGALADAGRTSTRTRAPALQRRAPRPRSTPTRTARRAAVSRCAPHWRSRTRGTCGSGSTRRARRTAAPGRPARHRGRG